MHNFRTYRTTPGRLGLDEALKKMQDNSVNPFEGWSSARIRAYQMIEQNPNSYYYRFNAPGEEQRKGQWNEEERTLFHKRLKEVGSNGQWGIFAMKIPGRVGYQCSNFYRLLVETNQIQDPNYVLDENGKAHYLFDKKKVDGSTEKIIRTHSKHGSGGRAALVSSSSSSTADLSGPETPEALTISIPAILKNPTGRKSTATAIDKKKRKRKTMSWDSDDEDDQEDDFEDYNDKSGTFKVRSNTNRRTRSKVQTKQGEDEDEEDKEIEEDKNPLPGFVDPITLDEVVKPAISTYGHVMG